jgi:hypothetical protein
VLEKEIVEFGINKFQEKAKMDIFQFLKLIKIYLQSSYVEFEGKYYTQKKGVCIGSVIASIATELYMAHIDRLIMKKLEALGLERKVSIYRFVDDFWIGHSREIGKDLVKEIFTECFGEMEYTIEESNEDGGVQFLDLYIIASSNSLCWIYKQRSTKPLLGYASNHSNIVKRGIINNCIRSACLKSCSHNVNNSTKLQNLRFQTAGYPEEFIRDQAEILMKKLRTPSEKEETERKYRVGFPYIHNISNRLKSIAKDLQVELVSSIKEKNDCLPRMVEKDKTLCTIGKTHPQFIACKDGVIYQIPLKCGRNYTGQTEKCVNVRMEQHKKEIQKKEDGNSMRFNEHFSSCFGCKPLWEGTTVSGNYPTRRAREIWEAMMIEETNAISSPSIEIPSKIKSFLNGWRQERRKGK